MRKIKLSFGISNDKTEMYLTCIKYEENIIESVEKDYLLKDFDYMSLYNTILDDLDGEFDNTLADMIDVMVHKVIRKGSEKNEI